MSFILDALRRAEAERRSAPDPDASSPALLRPAAEPLRRRLLADGARPGAPGRHATRLGWLAALVALAGAGAAWTAWQMAPEPPDEALADEPAMATAPPARVARVSPPTHPPVVADGVGVATAARAGVPATGTAPATPAGPGTATAAEAVGSAPAGTPTALPHRAPARPRPDGPPSAEAPGPLARGAPSPAAPARPGAGVGAGSVLAPDRPGGRTGSGATRGTRDEAARPVVRPASASPAAVRPDLRPDAAPAAVHVEAGLTPPHTTGTPNPLRPAGEPLPPWLSDLPDAQRRALPPLAITGVVYAEHPAQRLLIVNGQVLAEGAVAAPGVTLAHIGPHASVFAAGASRFRVPH